MAPTKQEKQAQTKYEKIKRNLGASMPPFAWSPPANKKMEVRTTAGFALARLHTYLKKIMKKIQEKRPIKNGQGLRIRNHT
jgi:hypothetical protein